MDLVIFLLSIRMDHNCILHGDQSLLLKRDTFSRSDDFAERSFTKSSFAILPLNREIKFYETSESLFGHENLSRNAKRKIDFRTIAVKT